MATKPTDLPQWASSEGDRIVEPTAAAKSGGFPSGKKPAAQIVNWLLLKGYRWFEWLNAAIVEFASDDSIELRAGKFRAYNAAGSSSFELASGMDNSHLTDGTNHGSAAIRSGGGGDAFLAFNDSLDIVIKTDGVAQTPHEISKRAVKIGNLCVFSIRASWENAAIDSGALTIEGLPAPTEGLMTSAPDDGLPTFAIHGVLDDGGAGQQKWAAMSSTGVLTVSGLNWSNLDYDLAVSGVYDLGDI